MCLNKLSLIKILQINLTWKTDAGQTPILIAFKRITCSALLFDGYQLTHAVTGVMFVTRTCCGATGASKQKFQLM